MVTPLAGLAAGSVAGTSSYLDVSVPDARLEIGSTAYDRRVWGTAVNPEAKLLLLSHAFDVLGAGRVQLKTDVRNHRSQQAIARLGARYEATLRRYQRREDGTVRDTVLFSILAEEWPAVRDGLEAPARAPQRSRRISVGLTRRSMASAANAASSAAATVATTSTAIALAGTVDVRRQDEQRAQDLDQQERRPGACQQAGREASGGEERGLAQHERANISRVHALRPQERRTRAGVCRIRPNMKIPITTALISSVKSEPRSTRLRTSRAVRLDWSLSSAVSVVSIASGSRAPGPERSAATARARPAWLWSRVRARKKSTGAAPVADL